MSNITFERNSIPVEELKPGQFFKRGDEIYITCTVKLGEILLICLNDGFLWDENPCSVIPAEFVRISDGIIKIEV